MHARALGANAEHVENIAALEPAMRRARASDRTYLISIDTDPARPTEAGGWWWEVAVAEVSSRATVRAARERYEQQTWRVRSARRTRRVHAFNVRIGINPLSWMNDDLPVARRRDAAEHCAQRRASRSATRASNWETNFRVNLGHCGRCSPNMVSRSSPAGIPGGSPRRGAEQEIEAVGSHLDLLAKNGARVLVYGEVADSIQGLSRPLYQRPRFVSDERWHEYANRLDALAAFTLSRGVRLAYHHHMGAYVETSEDLDRLMDLTAEAVGLLLDTGHLAFAGADPLAVLDRWIARVCHVHCKDVRPEIITLARNRDWSFLDAVLNGVFTVPGDGAVDFSSIIERLRRHGYRGWLVVEAEQDPVIAPSYAYAAKGYATLRRLIDGDTQEAA